MMPDGGVHPCGKAVATVVQLALATAALLRSNETDMSLKPTAKPFGPSESFKTRLIVRPGDESPSSEAALPPSNINPAIIVRPNAARAGLPNIYVLLSSRRSGREWRYL